MKKPDPVNNLLFEIGTEEIPSVYLLDVRGQLENVVRAAFARHRVAIGGELRIFYTPRRLTFFAAGVASAQTSIVEEIKGPPRSVAYDASGTALKPALAFAEKCGIALSDIRFTEAGGKEYLFFEKKHVGRKTFDLLPDLLSEIVAALRFPKTMRWNAHTVSFTRPVRWLLAIFNARVVPVRFGPLKASNVTFGHRFLGSACKAAIAKADPALYVKTLRRLFVVADADERRNIILKGLEAIYKKRGVAFEAAKIDRGTLDLTSCLVEWPVPLAGSFGEEFLDLPADVPVTVMKKHQRYFAVEKAPGKLEPMFITVSNMQSRKPQIIVRGNERVLRARLTDAVFFWKNDNAVPLLERAPRLEGMIFQEKLGSYAAKVRRVKALIGFIADSDSPLIAPALSAEQKQNLLLAADLYKCDLLTDVVKEFPELQGIMGCHLAVRQNHPEPVCQAVRNHYFPREAADESHRRFDIVSSLLNVADKLDTIAGCFSIGLIPSGSQDPYGLRRQANGVVKIGLNLAHLSDGRKLLGEYELNLLPALLKAYDQFPPAGAESEKRKNLLVEFFRERILAVLAGREFAAQLRERFAVAKIPMAADEAALKPFVSAALEANGFNLPDVKTRICDLLVLASSGRESLQKAAKVMERTRNILKGAKQPVPAGAAAREDLLRDSAEKDLFSVFAALRPAVEGLLSEKNYIPAVKQMGETLFAPLNRFFDDVLVNCPEADVRANRLALMKQINDLLARDIGDLSVLADKGPSV